MRIAIIGGTGNLGQALALRWARCGHDVIIGSRDCERAASAAEEINRQLPGATARGLANGAAAAAAEVVVLAIPWAAHAATLQAIHAACQGKVVLDTTVPMGDRPTVPGLEGDSAAERVQRVLGPNCRVAAGFHHISAKALANLERAVESDVLICGDDAGARQLALGLAADLPARAFECGNLAAARTLERLTPLIIALNMHYKRRHIGLRLTGIGEASP